MDFKEFYIKLDESLTAEKQLFDNPQDEFVLEVDPEDDNEGIIHYMGYDFPVSKSSKGGGVEYLVGSVAKSVVVRGNGPHSFSKVIAAIDAGHVPASANTKSSIFSKVQRDIPDTVEIEMADGTMKQYNYIAPGEVDDFVTKMYDQHGAKYQEYTKGYATDRVGNIHNPYIPINMIARQNVFRHKLGTKDGSINYKTR